MARTLVAGIESIGDWVVWGRALVGGAGTWLAAPVLLLLPTRAAPQPSLPPEPPWPHAPRDVQTLGEDSKYDLGASAQGLRLESRDEREPGDLPSGYGTDRITLLARDPFCVFAYWELTPGRRAPALAELGPDAEGACQVLRLYAATTADRAPTVSFDVDLPADLGSRYLTVSSPGAVCRAEIGLRTGAGRFLPLVSSNTVIMPSAAASTDTSVRWIEMTPGTSAIR